MMPEVFEPTPCGDSWSAQAAAEAAAARATRCRERLAALRSARGVSADDALAARNSLGVAQRRATAAAMRLELRRGALSEMHRRAGEMATRVATYRSLGPSSSSALLRKLHASEETLDSLFEAYFGLGGSHSYFEIDAYLHGVAGLPEPERLVLEHALWELVELS